MIAKYVLLVLIAIPLVHASALGVFPVNETFAIKPFKNYNIAFYFFNPSENDEAIDLSISCMMGKDKYDYANVFPKRIEIPKNTSMENSKIALATIKNPVFIKGEATIGKAKIKYIKPIIGQKGVECRLLAKTEGQTSLAITANLKGKIYGLNLAKLSVALILAAMLLFLRFS